MSLVCGIDEAGYGPTLGPLVVTAAVFETDGETHAVRKALETVAACEPSASRPALCDSKRLHSGPRRLHRLERNLLPFMAAGSDDYREILAGVCDASGGSHPHCPWYAEALSSIPLCGDAEGIARDAERIRVGLWDAGVTPADLWMSALDATDFNAAVRRTDNKADVLFEIVSRFLSRLWDRSDGHFVEVWVDKQGGRDRYAARLADLFPGAWTSVIEEGRRISSYEVRDNARRMRIRFVVRGESAHQAVALASMCSKYVRELFMTRFNAYWRRRVPGLAPTQGYAQDAARFLRDIAERREGVSDDILVRCR